MQAELGDFAEPFLRVAVRLELIEGHAELIEDVLDGSFVFRAERQNECGEGGEPVIVRARW